MENCIETPKVSEILSEEFMQPLSLSAYHLAQEIHVQVSRIQDILHDRRKITADTSIRLGKFFLDKSVKVCILVCSYYKLNNAFQTVEVEIKMKYALTESGDCWKPIEMQFIKCTTEGAVKSWHIMSAKYSVT